MSIPVTEIAVVLKLLKEGVEWAQNQKKLGNISEEDFEAIFERIEMKKKGWDDLAPTDEE